MNRHGGRRLLPAMIALALCLAALPAAAAEGDVPPADDAGIAYTYTYKLEETSNPESGTQFRLSVSGVDAAGDPAPLLHTGSMALGVTLPAGVSDLALRFQPESGYQLVRFDGSPAPEDPAYPGAYTLTETAEDGRPYLGFVWMVRPGAGALPGGEQILGTLTVGRQHSTPQDVSLIPWPMTEMGREVLGRDLEDDVRDVLVGSVWRMENTSDRNVGCYQGYYAQAGEQPTGQQRTDIVCGWQPFQISAYAAKNPITLKLYKRSDATGEYVSTPAIAMVSPTSVSAAGRFTVPVYFGELEYTNQAGGAITSFTEGTYKLVVSKQSHVTMSYEGLTAVLVEGKPTFPQLEGITVAPACGDVNGDDAVRQSDLARLLRPGNLGVKTDGSAALDKLDLDGDGWVRQSDLAILTAQANYGRTGKTVDLSPVDEGEGT